MSTKIYSGFRFRSTEFAVIHKQLEELREFIAADAKTRTIDLIRTWMIMDLDDAASRCREVESHLVSRQTTKLWDRQTKIKQTGGRDPLVDFDFEIVVLFDPQTKFFYGVYSTEKQVWEAHLKTLPWLVPYFYWDNSDQPDDVTDSDWDERAKVWDRLLGYQAPKFCGYLFQVDTSHLISGDMRDLLLDPSKVPSIHERAKAQAKRDALDFKIKQNYTPDVDGLISNATLALFAARDWIDSKEGQEFIERRTNDLSTVIRPFDETVMSI